MHAWQAWVDQLRSGPPEDELAFDALFNEVYPQLCDFVNTIINAPDIAEEVAEDVLVWIWQHRLGLPKDVELKPYLYQSAYNGAMKQLRRHKVETRWLDNARYGQSETAASADGTVVEHEMELAVRNAVTGLPDRCREVFVLSREHGLSYQQIAQVMGISQKTVEAQMSRAFKALRSAIKDFLPGK